ncbi:MAG: DUF6455 family protein [Hyphomicrobium sp.]
MEQAKERYVERQACRAREMAQRLDVDPVKLTQLRGGDAYAGVRMKCLACEDARECVHWLDADPPRSEVPGFCPNVEVYEACKKI